MTTAPPEILEKLRRPLVFASKDDFANIDTVRDLDVTMLSMLSEALELGPPENRREAFEALRALFDGYSKRDTPERRRRLREALKILDGLAEPQAENEPRAPREARPAREPRSARKPRTPREPRTAREPRAERDRRAPREPRAAREPRDGSEAPQDEAPQAEPKPEPKAKPERKPKSEPKAKAETKPKAKPRTRSKADSKPESEGRALTPGQALASLTRPVTSLKGIGPKYAEILERLEIRTVEDLLFALPCTYMDRRQLTSIQDATVGKVGVFAGAVAVDSTSMSGPPRKQTFELVVRDDTGELTAKWFNYPAGAAKRFEKGQRVVLAGKVDTWKDKLQVVHPDIEVLEGDKLPESFARIVPVYSLTEGLSQNVMRKFVVLALEEHSDAVFSSVPPGVLKQRGWPTPVDALRALHVPSPDSDFGAMCSGLSDAHRTLAYDELYTLQLGLALRRHEATSAKGLPSRIVHAKLAVLRDLLPFKLTNAQERVINEIKRDMRAKGPMRRLVQGDVGSGKTIVGLIAAVIAVDNDRQVAFMAPTEVVAEQHFERAGTLLERLGIKVALLTGSIRPTERDGLYPKIANGKVDVVIGTHALLSEGVTFKKLGLAIIDEQHRFGVGQRAALAQKGGVPDVLYLTATPIPRSMALTVFGDLDVSTISEKPEGRQEIETTVLEPAERKVAYDAIREQLAIGCQAYVVYPTIDASDVHVESAEEAYQRLGEVFPDYKVGMLHGRLSREEKDGVIRRFRKGAIDLLVATTVVGVGVDVPNATVMLIEGADRFGLADLHQLRGRVGRGEAASQCFLIPREDVAADAYGRLRVIAGTADGFQVAEADLVTRGFGDIAGMRQAGLPRFRVSDLARDTDLLIEARDAATELVRSDPKFRRKENRIPQMVVEHRWKPENLITEGG